VTSIRAHVEIDGVTHPVGELHSTLRRGRLTSTFTYERDYLGLKQAYAIEPALGLSGGNWPLSRELPRSFDDAAPDRWGRNLISKRFRAEATASGGSLPTLDDRDYLLGVSDETRQGALRFTIDATGEFQHPSTDVPKLIALPTLLRAAEHVARNDPDGLTAIKTLLDAGTGSLGGARPKASVRDESALLIAKFPHHSDEWDVMAWEKTALDLAKTAGISVPTNKLVEVDGRSVLLLERFDRAGGRRLGYISAMTLVEADDGQSRDYLEVADAITENSAQTSADLRELWRRIAFSIAIHNTDDHLRNHGFLRRGGGWMLAPAFDMNPNPDLGSPRVTSIGGASDPAAEVKVLLAYAESFDLTDEAARRVLSEVADATSGWMSVARSNGVPRSECQRFEPALRQAIAVVADAAAAR
jgi:serine/threonine-protein kinase HipA